MKKQEDDEKKKQQKLTDELRMKKLSAKKPKNPKRDAELRVKREFFETASGAVFA